MQITILEFLFRGVWESLIFLTSVLLMSNIKVKISKLTLFTLIFSVIIYLIRLLPISFGVHTMLILVVLNIIAIVFFNAKIEKTIKSTVIVACILFACEGINSAILLSLFGSELRQKIQDPINKLVFYMPSMIAFGFFNYLAYLFIKKRRIKDGSNTLTKDSPEDLNKN